MGKSAAGIAFYAYIIPFFISTAMGAVISGIIVLIIKKAGFLVKIQDNIKEYTIQYAKSIVINRRIQAIISNDKRRCNIQYSDNHIWKKTSFLYRKEGFSECLKI